MSDFFAELEAQLHTAARAEAARRRGRAPVLHLPQVRSGIRALPILAGVGVALAVAAIALVATHHGSSSGGPAGSPGPTPQEIGYIREASRQAHASGACAPNSRRGPATSDGTPSRVMLSTLSVLRRPATAADRLPKAVTVGGDVVGVYVRYVRLARVVDGVSYYLVPAQASSDTPALSPHCVAAITTKLRHALPKIPVDLRAPTLAFAHRLLAADTAHPPIGGVVCLIAVGGGSNGGSCGAWPAEIRADGMLSGLAPVAGIVPDGVASVTVRYPAANGHPARTVAAGVVGNVFAAPVRHFSAGHAGRPSMVWRDARGKVVKTIPATASGQGNSSFCQSSSSARHSIC
jgi:hypothetical protein